MLTWAILEFGPSVWRGHFSFCRRSCLGYLGQGALILLIRAQRRLRILSSLWCPAGSATYLLVLLSSAATVIASQALISGAFSLTRQAMLLGYLPRVTIKHTAYHTEGQIYIPEVNSLLAVGCIALVLTFRESVKLAAAYGIAVTGTMAITSILYYIVVRHSWGWSKWQAGSSPRTFPEHSIFLF